MYSTEIESVTSVSVKTFVLIALALGVGFAWHSRCFAIFDGIKLWHILLQAISLLLYCFVRSELFVVWLLIRAVWLSGPMTGHFLLSLCAGVGKCKARCQRNWPMDLESSRWCSTPLITLQLLGLIYQESLKGGVKMIINC